MSWNVSSPPVAKGTEKSQKNIMDERDEQDYKSLLEESRYVPLTDLEMKRLNDILIK